MNNNKQTNNQHIIQLQISDFILTPLSCASLINEILKSLLYQRSQIPYTYNWLMSIVTKKRKSTDSNCKSKNFTVQNHLRAVSNAYDTIENIMGNISEQMKLENIKEVAFVIGATPFAPKEVYSIRINSLNHGHNESSHVLDCKKNQHKILRQIFLSEMWMDSSTSPCTNTYIFIKKKIKLEDETYENSFFKPCQPLFVSNRIKHLIIEFSSDLDSKFLCCTNLKVFGDPQETIEVVVKNEDDGDDYKEVWFQANNAIQGFKDCYVNQVSASELW